MSTTPPPTAPRPSSPKRRRGHSSRRVEREVRPERQAQDHQAAEDHVGGRTAWLRAAVLGANDGLISTAELMVGVGAAANDRAAILIAGVAGLTAGARSLAAGEYVSVASQRDAELSELDRERAELAESPEAERAELAGIYRKRGLSAELAERVADELSQFDQLTIHARDELGVDIDALANPIQAAVSSAVSFIAGAVIPIVVVLLASASLRLPLTIGGTLISLVALGALGARLGHAPRLRASLRVLAGGALALGISLVVGRLTGAAF
jgi:vacuolar iron transporter family protein